MSPKRYRQLERTGSRLTNSELLKGWHWCYEFDGLLVGPGMTELNCCNCLPKDHPVYKTAPEIEVLVLVEGDL